MPARLSVSTIRHLRTQHPANRFPANPANPTSVTTVTTVTTATTVTITTINLHQLRHTTAQYRYWHRHRHRGADAVPRVGTDLWRWP